MKSANLSLDSINSDTKALVSGTMKRKSSRKEFQDTRHPIYNRVRQNNGKTVSELRQPSDKAHACFGTFSDPEMAARAYDVAALTFRGDVASLNFSETSQFQPKTKSSSRDIQCAGLEAAEAHSGSMSTPEDLEKLLEGSGSLSFDEEELFNMPVILDGMAEGLILTPLFVSNGFHWDDGEDNDMDLTLWTE